MNLGANRKIYGKFMNLGANRDLLWEIHEFRCQQKDLLWENYKMLRPMKINNSTV